MSPRDLFAIQAAPEEMKNDSPATLKQLAPEVVEEKFAGTGIGRKQFVWIVEDLGLSDEEGEKRLSNHGITVSEDETMKKIGARAGYDPIELLIALVIPEYVPKKNL